MISFKIKTVGFIPGVPRWKSTLNRMLKAAYAVGGTFWHRALRPKHFTKAGAREYWYTPRKGEAGSGEPFKKGKHLSYTAAKLRRHGHTLPLVFSGELRLKSRMARIAATSKGVRVVLPSAQKANLRHPESQINMREELTRVSSREVIEIARVDDKHLDRQIKRMRSVHRQTIKG